MDPNEFIGDVLDMAPTRLKHERDGINQQLEWMKRNRPRAVQPSDNQVDNLVDKAQLMNTGRVIDEAIGTHSPSLMSITYGGSPSESKDSSRCPSRAFTSTPSDANAHEKSTPDQVHHFVTNDPTPYRTDNDMKSIEHSGMMEKMRDIDNFTNFSLDNDAVSESSIKHEDTEILPEPVSASFNPIMNVNEHEYRTHEKEGKLYSKEEKLRVIDAASKQIVVNEAPKSGVTPAMVLRALAGGDKDEKNKDSSLAKTSHDDHEYLCQPRTVAYNGNKPRKPASRASVNINQYNKEAYQNGG